MPSHRASLFVFLLSALFFFTTIASSETSNPLFLNKRLNSASNLPQALPIGTCNANTPCENKACCGTNGLCGYSPSECGNGNCTSNCDAKAECGQYGVAGKNKCPLNVCCSKFGFCGSTDDFCGTGCQSGFGGCGPPNRPSCGGSSASKRTIGYYESWADTRKCQKVAPEDLNLNGYTHINFAFAFFDPKTFDIAPMDGHSGSLYNRFTALKNTRQGLKAWISVGGWSFTDPGPTRKAFSDMSSTSANRQKFIGGLAAFMDTYGFDGVDIDWEYPQADDRGGSSGDTANFVTLVKEMKAAFGGRYGISVTLPTSYWYLQHFDLTGLQQSVDWFNLMSYDLHGVWDADSKFVGPYIAPHTNLTEIDLGMDLLWRAGVKSENVVLGQGWYGRSFTLKDPSCNTPNGVCQFSGGAKAGSCSDASGILNNQEIFDIIKSKSLTPTWDKTAGVKWITWDSNQWVSYDDDDTFKQKRDFANKRCLGGMMVWAIDQVDQKADNGLAPAPGITTVNQQDAKQKADDLNAKSTCYTSDCNKKCNKGNSQAAQMNGQPGQLGTNGQCPKGQYRNLCCASGTTMGKCQWRGFRGAGLSCISGCDDGETEVTTNSNSHDGKNDKECTGGLQSYCCKGFKPAPSKDDLKDKAKDAAKDAAIGVVENVALDIAAKAFCRVAVPALLLPLEAAEALIPIVGEILDIAEIAATPALILACEKGIEKAGKAEFKIFGKKHTLEMKDPPKEPNPRPPKSTHTPAKTSSACAAPGVTAKAKRVNDPDTCERPAKRPRRRDEKTITIAVRDDDWPKADIDEITCDYDKQGDACLHYRSVSSHHPNLMTVTCPYWNNKGRGKAPYVTKYNLERDGGWINKIPDWPGKGVKGCERDEWPPAHFIADNDHLDDKKICEPGKCARHASTPQFIRLINGDDNGDAGQLFKCDDWSRHRNINPVESLEKGKGGRDTMWTSVTAAYTRRVYTVSFKNMNHFKDDGDDGLKINVCQPQQKGSDGVAIDHRGFALLNEDPWFKKDKNDWAAALTASYAKAPVFKRDLSSLDPDEIGIVDGNSTRKATDEELREHLGILRCKDRSCSDVLREIGVESAAIVAPPLATPFETVAGTLTLALANPQPTRVGSTGSTPEVRLSSPNLPRRTAAPEFVDFS